MARHGVLMPDGCEPIVLYISSCICCGIGLMVGSADFLAQHHLIDNEHNSMGGGYRSQQGLPMWDGAEGRAATVPSVHLNASKGSILIRDVSTRSDAWQSRFIHPCQVSVPPNCRTFDADEDVAPRAAQQVRGAVFGS